MGCTHTKNVNASGQPKTTVQVDEEKALDPSLIAEALRIFDLADKDHNGQLDMEELSDVRNSKDLAMAMMGEWDVDLSGTLNKDEWLNYFAKAFENNEKVSTVLKAYEKQIQENNNGSEQNSTTKVAEPNQEPDPEESITATNPAEPIIEETTVRKKNWCCA